MKDSKMVIYLAPPATQNFNKHGKARHSVSYRTHPDPQQQAKRSATV